MTGRFPRSADAHEPNRRVEKVDRSPFPRPHDGRLPAVGGTSYAYTAECIASFGEAECWTFPLLRHTEEFNAVFPVTRMTSVAGVFEDGEVDNNYSAFKAGGGEWLVLTLEMYPRATVVAWAQDVVAQHPDHNVIVQTHPYLDADGSIHSFDSFAQASSPQYLYDNLISRYPNIKLVLSGHTGQTATRMDTGVDGNQIVSLLTAVQGSTTNKMRLITIDVADGSLRTWLTSPRTGETSPEESVTDVVTAPAPTVAPVESAPTTVAAVMPTQTNQASTEAEQAKKLKKKLEKLEMKFQNKRR